MALCETEYVYCVKYLLNFLDQFKTLDLGLRCLFNLRRLLLLTTWLKLCLYKLGACVRSYPFLNFRTAGYILKKADEIAGMVDFCVCKFCFGKTTTLLNLSDTALLKLIVFLRVFDRKCFFLFRLFNSANLRWLNNKNKGNRNRTHACGFEGRCSTTKLYPYIKSLELQDLHLLWSFFQKNVF